MAGGIKKEAFMVVVVVVLATAVQVSMSADLMCNMSQAGLSACKPSVTAPNPTKPSKDCCDALKGADFKCLCSFKDNPVLRSFGIDPSLALQLPGKCKLSVKPDC